MSLIEPNSIHRVDCMDGLREMPDNYVDLAIVDPPYGIGANRMTLGNGKRKLYRGGDDWDRSPPSREYFSELDRVSINRIIWGGNYYADLCGKNSSCWVVWDKCTGANSFADCELAYTSFCSVAKIFKHSWVGANAKENSEKDRIHPTQKPIALYKWLLQNYAKEGDLILDTHMGSGSLYIACLDMGFDYIGYEIDADYFEEIEHRVYNFTRQTTLFS